MNKNQLGILLIISVIAGLMLGATIARTQTKVPQVQSADKGLKIFRESDLKKYDGTDSALPIYIALNGYVYDVTPGKEFYQDGGAYHYLAGRDSSTELNLVGGGIIRSKYQVVGRLEK